MLINPLDHQRLVYSIAKRFQGRGLDMEDLVQEGNLGLLAAIERFDPERGVRFGSFATHCIRNRITVAVEDTGRAIRLPRTSRLAGACQAARDVILNAGWQRDGYGVDKLRLADLVADSVADEDLDLDWELVKPLLDELPERWRIVIDLHYGLVDREPRSLGEIGSVLGVTKTRAGQILVAAHGRLRSGLNHTSRKRVG